MRVQSVLFGPDVVEISYAEERDFDPSTGVQEIRTLSVPVGLLPDALAEVMDSLQQYVDAVAVERRSPPARLR